MSTPSKQKTRSFTPARMAVPTPTAPIDGAIVSGDHLDVRWADSEGTAEAYYVEIASDEAFTRVKMVILAQTGVHLRFASSVLGADQAYYWRVRRQEGGQWSEAARFQLQTMSASPASMHAPAIAATPEPPAATEDAVSTRPVPLSPTEANPVQGAAATFSWTDPLFDGQARYQLQLSADEAFEQEVLTVDAGRTTVLSLMGLLPENGTQRYWRVGRHEGRDVTWGPVAHCTLVDEDEALAWQEAVERARIAAERMRLSGDDLTPEEVEASAPWRTGQTEASWSGSVILFMMISFLTLFATLLVI
ncbi:MAG: hypothetical protein AAGI71_13060 [Bacteroidota bacterium]